MFSRLVFLVYVKNSPDDDKDESSIGTDCTLRINEPSSMKDFSSRESPNTIECKDSRGKESGLKAGAMTRPVFLKH